MIKIIVERDYQGKLQIGTMHNGVWHYADLPADITTKQAIETLIASKAQGKEYIITYSAQVDD